MTRGTVLVSGATGFVGRAVVTALVLRGYGVRALVRQTGALRGIAGVSEIRGDITRAETLHGVGDGVDAVIHCAGLLGRWGCGEARLHDVNVIGTLNLLGACGDTRFVHLSAGGVTGPTGEVVADEDFICAPVTAYERTKLEAERQVLRLGQQRNAAVIVVRPTFTYGPGDAHKLALFRAIQRHRFALIDGGGSANTPVFIDDVVRGVIAALERGGSGEVYILGGPRVVSKREMVACIAATLGVKAPKVSLPRWLMWWGAGVLEALFARASRAPLLTRSKVMMMADNFMYRSDKAVRDLGYRPAVDLFEGIARTVDDYRSREWL